MPGYSDYYLAKPNAHSCMAHASIVATSRCNNIVGATIVVALVGGYPNCSNVFCGYFITGWHKASPYINKAGTRPTPILKKLFVPLQLISITII